MRREMAMQLPTAESPVQSSDVAIEVAASNTGVATLAFGRHHFIGENA